MSESEIKGSILVVRFAVAMALWPFTAAWRAYVLVTLWAWFAVPLGLPALGKAHAYGLAILASILVMRARIPNKHDEDVTSLKAFIDLHVEAALAPAFALLGGWVAHLVMVR
jgi:hypothetical protein